MEKVRITDKINLRNGEELTASDRLNSRNDYTLEETLAAYDGVMHVKGFERDRMYEEVREHKALPYLLYVILRGLHFSLELVVYLSIYVGVLTVFQYEGSILSIDNRAVLDGCSALIVLLIFGTIPFTIKYLSSMNGWLTRMFGFRVVDKNGWRLSGMACALRSLAFLLTWFLLPLHLLFIATGSRRFIHDYAAGSYVLFGEEDLETTFYPRIKPWLAFVMVAACIYSIGFKMTDLPVSFQKAEVNCVGVVTGTESKLCLQFLEWQYAKLYLGLDHIDRNKARDFQPIYAQMAALRAKYYGVEDFTYKSYKFIADELSSKAKQ